MRSKAVAVGMPSTPLPVHLGRHFLGVADLARENQDKELSIHFIELALEAFNRDFEGELGFYRNLLEN